MKLLKKDKKTPKERAIKLSEKLSFELSERKINHISSMLEYCLKDDCSIALERWEEPCKHCKYNVLKAGFVDNYDKLELIRYKAH